MKLCYQSMSREKASSDYNRALQRMFIAVALLAFSANAHAQNCAAGELRFAFNNLEVRKAFAIFADHAGLKANIDQSIPYSSPMHFGCTRWEVAAKQLADKYNLTLRIENGTMYVSKK